MDELEYETAIVDGVWRVTLAGELAAEIVERDGRFWARVWDFVDDAVVPLDPEPTYDAAYLQVMRYLDGSV